MTRRTAARSLHGENVEHHVDGQVNDEQIDHDDNCPICQVLLYHPVKTRCGHTLCEGCMTLWADVSISTQMRIVGLDDEPIALLPADIETGCPMCRTPTTATLDRVREAALQRQYPTSYQARHVEEQTAAEADFVDSVETLTLYIGNEHHLIRPDHPHSANKHQWKFFVRPSRTDLIEEVQMFLVGTAKEQTSKGPTLTLSSTQPSAIPTSLCSSHPIRLTVLAGELSQLVST